MGTASDAGGGTVARVDVSVDDGATFNPATGTTSWSFSWTPIVTGQVTIRSRAVDNSGNQQDPPTKITVTSDALPAIASRSPADGETNVSLDANILVTFTEAMDPASLNESTIFLSPKGQIPATLSYDAATFTVTLDPIAPLKPGRSHRMLVVGGDAGVKDLAGNPLQGGAQGWGFTTSPRPRVVFTTPADRATGVSTGVAPRAIFSKPLDPTSVNAETVLLRDTANNPVPCAISLEAGNHTVRITPQQPLVIVIGYTVVLRGGFQPHITSASGAPLAADFEFSFMTDGSLSLALLKETMPGDWVTTGANFIAMRPDRQFGYLLGLNDAPSILSWLLISAL